MKESKNIEVSREIPISVAGRCVIATVAIYKLPTNEFSIEILPEKNYFSLEKVVFVVNYANGDVRKDIFNNPLISNQELPLEDIYNRVNDSLPEIICKAKVLLAGGLGHSLEFDRLRKQVFRTLTDAFSQKMPLI